MKDKKESKTLMFLWFFSTGVWSIALFLDFYHGTHIDKVALCMCLDFALRGDNSNESILKKEKRLTV